MIGTFDLFKIGIGPSSSHTMGPMKAAALFASQLAERGLLKDLARVKVELFGSLAWTGRGHGTDKAVVLGLAGKFPETIDPEEAETLVDGARAAGTLRVAERRNVPFDFANDIIFDGVTEPPNHPNTLALSAFDAAGHVRHGERWCSVGCGFVVP